MDVKGGVKKGGGMERAGNVAGGRGTDVRGGVKEGWERERAGNVVKGSGTEGGRREV